ncbi:uncharacterized protein DUF2523 [Sinobacterium caligoides]|uniref:Uncharacterized protein DUF2523 n=1 Tax=Sinobacterium caligoides TaxID=933926 RepID=A0A3N2DJF3_9GAMM|nr:DUF2523 family protein [Sinobacterium caligoides]ROR99919.1 uncharacterized protein DUF2523 [Sinobacterium caligoides]
MDQVMVGFQTLIDFFTVDVYTFFNEALVQLGSYVVIWMFKAKMVAMVFAYEVAVAVLDNIGLSAMINSAWGGIDSKIMGIITAFRIPDAINVLLNAYVTRFILGMF